MSIELAERILIPFIAGFVISFVVSYLSGSQFTLSLNKAEAEKRKMDYEKKDNGQSSRDKEMGMERE